MASPVAGYSWFSRRSPPSPVFACLPSAHTGTQHTHVHTHAWTGIHVHTRMTIHMLTHTCTYPCTHTCTHLQTHTHMKLPCAEGEQPPWSPAHPGPLDRKSRSVSMVSCPWLHIRGSVSVCGSMSKPCSQLGLPTASVSLVQDPQVTPEMGWEETLLGLYLSKVGSCRGRWAG